MSAEQFYATVLKAYPAWYRRERYDEMLGVLMTAETRPSGSETASLLVHGLALRFFGRRTPGVWRRPTAAATVLLACVVGVMGSQIALPALLHRDEYVDSLWPVAAVWCLTLALVLLRQGWAALVSAWSAVTLAVVVLAGSSDAGLSQSYDLLEGYQSVVFMAPSIVLALLLSGPGRVREGIDLLGYRMIGVVLGAVVVVKLFGGSAQALPLTAAVVSLLALYRHGLIMRGAVPLLVGFAWMGLIPLADGSGSRLPHDPVGLGVALGVLPVLVLGVVLLAVRNVELDGLLRRGLIAVTESLAEAARRTGRSIEERR